MADPGTCQEYFFKRMLLAKIFFKFHVWVQKCHFGNSSIFPKYPKHVPEPPKSRIYARKSTKRGFSKKALVRIGVFLFWVHMNPLKAWNAKLEEASFFAIKKTYKAVCKHRCLSIQSFVVDSHFLSPCTYVYFFLLLCHFLWSLW